tara:strand:+ start:87 stop:701 length:615 start_codon:yes stop_codon:yes gene_type:complete
MKIDVYKDPFPYILVKDLYTQEEEDLIKKECDFFLPSLTYNRPGGAIDVDTGQSLKKNRGVFLDDVWAIHRELSYIIRVSRKLFTLLEEQKEKIGHDNWFFKNLLSNVDNTLISYYEDNDHYLPHKDLGLYTVLTWFYKEPKSFTGGDFLFPDYDIRFECKNNLTIIFPSMITHAVENVKVDDDRLGQGFGRWTLTQIVNVKNS